MGMKDSKRKKKTILQVSSRVHVSRHQEAASSTEKAKEARTTENTD